MSQFDISLWRKPNIGGMIIIVRIWFKQDSTTDNNRFCRWIKIHYNHPIISFAKNPFESCTNLEKKKYLCPSITFFDFSSFLFSKKNQILSNLEFFYYEEENPNMYVFGIFFSENIPNLKEKIN